MSTVPRFHNNYEKIMMNAIDESLSTLGEQSKNLIYKYLSERYCLEKDQIPTNVEVFTNALENILGNGAKFLEFLIMKRFNEKIGNIFQLEDAEICNYMIAATEFSKKIIELVKLEKKCQFLSNDNQKQEATQNEPQ